MCRDLVVYSATFSTQVSELRQWLASERRDTEAEDISQAVAAQGSERESQILGNIHLFIHWCIVLREDVRADQRRRCSG